MNTLLPDDPRLTAYALGELDGDEHAAVEAALARNPALRSIVEEIRATAAQLEAALAIEPAPQPESVNKPAGVNGHAGAVSPHSEDCAAILPGSDPRVLDGGSCATPPEAAKMLRFPQFYYVIGGLAAACFAVIVALHRDDFEVREQVRAETLRVALEKRAAEARVAANDGAVLLHLPPIEEAEAGRDASSPKSEAVASATTVATDDLSLLQQARHVQQSRLADATSGTPAASPILPNITQKKLTFGTARAEEGAATIVSTDSAIPVRAVATAAAVNSRASLLASNTSVPSAPSQRPADANIASGLSSARPALAANDAGSRSLPYVPGTSNLDARFAPGGGVDLYPGPSQAKPMQYDALRSPPPLTLGEPKSVPLRAFTVEADVDAGYMASSTVSGWRSRGVLFGTGAIEERKARERLPASARVVHNTEAYAHVRDNDFLRAAQNPLSTFSIDVDTASYANVRRMIAQRTLPPPDAVRIEELVNYFPYRYPAPVVEPGRERSFMEKVSGSDNVPPFAASLEVAEAPWAPLHRLVRIGLKGREVPAADRAAANLVFLLDVSGSMNAPNKLPLVKESLRLLIDTLRPDDRVAIVTYAGSSGLALASTPVSRSREILDAIDLLSPGGSTNGAMGIQLAYDIAKANFAQGGVNRVILCTDGDFNVGTTSEGELVRLIEEKAASGVFLTVLGFGMGNYKDSTLEKLADKGNGTYGYIDSRREAGKLLVDQVNGTLVTIAKDVKIQVEFNPAKVASYRLIGYENRVLKKEDFNNDKVDAGEIGAGHAVTALYEIVPVGVETGVVADQASVDDLKYAANVANAASGSRPPSAAKREAAESDELLTVKVRYKKPDGLVSRKMEFPLTDSGAAFANASADLRFAAAVAQFGMILRKSEHKGDASIGDVIAWAASAASSPADDPGGYRGEFIDLARQTQQLLKTE